MKAAGLWCRPAASPPPPNMTSITHQSPDPWHEDVQAVTLAAALNDVGSWALVSWQATFYQRVYELGPETYAPALAGILPVGGILGGVGGGLMGDWLSRKGGLHYLTSGGTSSPLSLTFAPTTFISLLS